jgi:hypothetical protein
MSLTGVKARAPIPASLETTDKEVTMKRTLAVIAACMFMTSAALAEESHEHSAQQAKPPAAKTGMPMGGMHEHMKKMQEQMAQIRAATDPKEKERLVSEHLKTMEESMSKMQGMMGCGKM